MEELPLWLRPLANKSLHFVCCVAGCFAICGTFAWMKGKYKKACMLAWLKGESVIASIRYCNYEQVAMRIPKDRQKEFKALDEEMQVSDDFSPGWFTGARRGQ
jgi:hypothetical protein